MKKILIVSSTPFSFSNRGIDILTQACAEYGYDVTHMTLLEGNKNRFIKIKTTFDAIKQISLDIGFISYRDKVMYWLPENVIKAVIAFSLRNVHFDFSQYDYIVLESGKPILLAPCIPDNIKIIYRQSDPVSYMFKSPYLATLEIELCKRAFAIITIREMLRQELARYIDISNITTIINGFDAPSSSFIQEKYDGDNAIYIGYTPVDSEIIENLLKRCPNLRIHIIGNCISRFSLMRLKRYSNFIYYGNLSQNNYIPILQKCNIAIIPYKQAKYLEYVGLNSKYLLFMYYCLPIVSIEVGQQQEFGENPVYFCKKSNFVDAVINLTNNYQYPHYDIDFSFYCKQGRIEEYKKLFFMLDEQL